MLLGRKEGERSENWNLKMECMEVGAEKAWHGSRKFELE
jgi:hypothetical protein